jgi:F-type H+-transporting ATPase subunit a
VDDPLVQFKIKRLIEIKIGTLDLSFTNSSAFMLIAIVAITLFTSLSVRSRALVPGRWQSVAELAYEFVAGVLRDNVGQAGRPYFPFIFSLFMFILFCNAIGMIPYTFTVTSHIIVTFAMALFVFLGVTLIGFWKHGLHFLAFFVPHGVPKALLPLVVVIEVISFLSRPISLALRLFANMTAGHTMMKVFGSFVGLLGSAAFVVGGLLPLLVLIALTGLELVIAFLQAYVFTVLSCLYLNDSLHMSH